jgi:hypothetical protein
MNHPFIDFTKVAFWDIRKLDNEFSGHLTTWNIASSTSSKSHFGMPRREKMSSHDLSTPWNNALTTKRKSHFWQPEINYWILSPFRHLNLLILDFAKVTFWVCQRANNPISRCFETMNHFFNDINQVVFCGGQKVGCVF